MQKMVITIPMTSTMKTIMMKKMSRIISTDVESSESLHWQSCVPTASDEGLVGEFTAVVGGGVISDTTFRAGVRRDRNIMLSERTLLCDIKEEYGICTSDTLM